MRRYKVTERNIKAINGMIKKFKESCRVKGHCFKYNGAPVFPYLTMEQAKECSKYFPVITAVQVSVGAGCIVEFYGGNSIVIRRPDASVDTMKRIVPKNPKLKDEFVYKLNHPLMVTVKKRYGGTSVRSAVSADKPVPTTPDGLPVSVIPNPSKVLEYLEEHDFSGAAIAGIIGNLKIEKSSIVPPSHLDFDGDYAPNVDDPLAELVAKIYAHGYGKAASSACEAMYMDN